jgi:calcineurin-like phosphoesterase
VVLLALACRAETRGPGARRIPGESGAGPRVTVEVLNASGRNGLAKTATRMLRDAGIDVLTFRNAPDSLGTLDSTRIVVRRGTAALGERVREALGVGHVVVELDGRRLLDVSVLLGADFAPPHVEFHP